jgi:hypothetical protein
MKIPAPYRQDAPTAAEPVAAPVWSQKPAKTKAKSEVPLETHVWTPCDLCGGKFHPKYTHLKYTPSVELWLCSVCRQDLP